MGIKHVHENLTSLNGCKVEIDGDIDYSIIPLRENGFHGSVRISGGDGCPNGDTSALNRRKNRNTNIKINGTDKSDHSNVFKQPCYCGGQDPQVNFDTFQAIR
jgi:hypothetical protein